MAVRDAALGQVIWRHFHRDPVAVHDFDAVSAEPSRHGREHGLSYIELNREHSGLELLDHFAHYFDCIFFWQIFPLRSHKQRARHVVAPRPVGQSELTSGFVASRRRSCDIRRRPTADRPSA